MNIYAVIATTAYLEKVFSWCVEVTNFQFCQAEGTLFDVAPASYTLQEGKSRKVSEDH